MLVRDYDENNPGSENDAEPMSADTVYVICFDVAVIRLMKVNHNGHDLTHG